MTLHLYSVKESLVVMEFIYMYGPIDNNLQDIDILKQCFPKFSNMEIPSTHHKFTITKLNGLRHCRPMSALHLHLVAALQSI